MAENLSNFTAFVDESGCSGDQFDNGSSAFLAMGAVIVRDDFLADVMKLFDNARAERKNDKQFRKFSAENDKSRFVLCQLLGQSRVQTALVAVHKPSMQGTYIRQHHANEYNYLLKMLLERISWAVRDAPTLPGRQNGNCRLILSEQRMYPYDAMFEYVKRLRQGSHNCSAHWASLSGDDPEIKPHENETPVHLADIAASAFAMSIEPKMHGMTDDRFIRLLGKSIYTKHGKKFGLKIFPDKEMSETTKGLLKLF